MAELAPRPYGAGAYGRAPYENYTYATVRSIRGASASAGRVPFFTVEVWDDIVMLGQSRVEAGWAPATIYRQFNARGASTGSLAHISARVQRAWAGRMASESASVASAEVLLGLSLYGEALSGAQASFNNVKSHRMLVGHTASQGLLSKRVDRLWAATGEESVSASVGVLSPLWQCDTVDASTRSCETAPASTWEEATVSQSSWRGYR